MSQRLHHCIAAILTIAFMWGSLTTTTAHASCCDGVIFENTTGCSFWVVVYHAVDGTVIADLNVLSNQFSGRTFTECTDIEVRVVDRFGTSYTLPTTPGASVDVCISSTCCVNIKATGDCSWKVTPGVCAATC